MMRDKCGVLESEMRFDAALRTLAATGEVSALIDLVAGIPTDRLTVRLKAADILRRYDAGGEASQLVQDAINAAGEEMREAMRVLRNALETAWRAGFDAGETTLDCERGKVR